MCWHVCSSCSRYSRTSLGSRHGHAPAASFAEILDTHAAAAGRSPLARAICACACCVRTPLALLWHRTLVPLTLHPIVSSASSPWDPCIWRQYLLLAMLNKAPMQGPDPYLSLLQPLQPCAHHMHGRPATCCGACPADSPVCTWVSWIAGLRLRLRLGGGLLLQLN